VQSKIDRSIFVILLVADQGIKCHPKKDHADQDIRIFDAKEDAVQDKKQNTAFDHEK